MIVGENLLREKYSNSFDLLNLLSCTGLAIFVVSCLRAVGVPARVAGVPHWNKGPTACPNGDRDADCGNHSWVEAHDGLQWIFVSPGDSHGGVEHGWFYPDPARDQIPKSGNHSIYASSWRRSRKTRDPSGREFGAVEGLTPQDPAVQLELQENHEVFVPEFPVDHYPMVWAWHDISVPGWDVTCRYGPKVDPRGLCKDVEGAFSEQIEEVFA